MIRVASSLAVIIASVTLNVGVAFAAGFSYTVSPIVNLSASCSGQNAEVEQAVDPSLGYAYEVWMGCKGIAFAHSTDGGVTFDTPITVPGSVGSNINAWDPAIAVAPDGTVYATFMLAKASQWYPVVAASFDHGLSFPQVSSLIPPDSKNWGDREFIAVGPDGTVYVTWDYGPERTSISYVCTTGGSCAFSTGDVNVVLQASTDGGRTWSSMSYISPGFPASGADSAPLVVEPDGRIDVLYQGYQVTDPTAYALAPGFSYFTSSTDRGATWSTPLAVGAQVGTMSLSEWWIDGDLGIDAGGTLYATWDTQGTNADRTPNDIGWLSYSTDRGKHWSAPVQAPADQLDVPHIMQVAGAGSGIAYVSWLSDSDPRGYAEYLRVFSIRRGWLSDPIPVSSEFGDRSVWPGDTSGISVLAPDRAVLGWGSATPSFGKKSEVFAARVTVQLP